MLTISVILAQKFVEETNLDGLVQDTLYGVRVAAQLDAAGTIGALSRQVLHRIGPVMHDNFDLKPIKISPTYVLFQWEKPSGVVVNGYKVRLCSLCHKLKTYNLRTLLTVI